MRETPVSDKTAIMSARFLFLLFALLFTAEEGPGQVNAPSKLQDSIPSCDPSTMQSMMVQVDRAVSI